MSLNRALRSEVLSASCVLEMDLLRDGDRECGRCFVVLSAFSRSRSLILLPDSLGDFGQCVLSSDAFAPDGLRLRGGRPFSSGGDGGDLAFKASISSRRLAFWDFSALYVSSALLIASFHLRDIEPPAEAKTKSTFLKLS